MRYRIFLIAFFASFSCYAFNVTFRVDMSHVTGFTTPEVNGTFNNWCGSCAPMSDLNNDQIWELTIPLNAGTYEYKFSYDNFASQEQLIVGSSCTITSFGYTNRSLNVTSDIILPVVCYGFCLPCSQIYSDVTFSVDVNYLPIFADSSYTNPLYIFGSFNNWCTNCTPLTDANNDGIWEVTLSLLPGNYEYKFTHNDLAGSEGLIGGDFCTTTSTSYNNRLLTVTTDTVLPTVCFNSCHACSEITHDVTFQLDMNYAPISFTTPAVIGGFNNSCGNCLPLSDPNGDNIWEATATILDGDYQYKFTTDNNTAYEELDINDLCVVYPQGYTNRFLQLSSDTVLPLVCWGHCQSCDDLVKSVTFQLDMSQVSGFLTPEVNGTFNNWCGSCGAMTDANQDGVWEFTKQMLPGHHEFKYTYDNQSVWENLPSDGLCVISNVNYSNRYIELVNDTVLPPTCWSTCSACVTPVPAAIQITSISPAEIDVSESFNVSFALYNTVFSAGNQFRLEMSGLDGTFNNPFILATLNSTFGGTFQDIILPLNVPANCYNLRIVSTNPVVSSSGNDAIKINSLTAEPGNYALRFDGLNDYANLGPVIPAGDFSVSFWVKPNSQGNQVGDIGGIADLQNDLYVYGNPNVVDNFILSHLLQFDLLLDQWNHITITMDAANSFRKVYIFGQLVDQNTWTYAPTQNHLMLLGSTSCSFCGGAFNGLIDEVKIWDRVLTPQEVLGQVQTTLVGNEANLVAYYTFNEGCSVEVLDATASQHDGVLINGTSRVISDVPVWASNIEPNEGGNINVVNVTVRDFFQSPVTTATLIREGFPSIVTTSIYPATDQLSVLVAWNLTGVALGQYDIQLSLADGTTKFYPQSFTVIEGIAPDVWVDIVGRNVWRNGRPFNFLVTYGNDGNVDAKGVPIWLIIKGDTLININTNFEIVPPAGSYAQSLIDSVPTFFASDGLFGEEGQFLVFPLYIPVISPGEIGTLSFSITNISSNDLEFLAYSTTPHYQSPINENVSSCVTGMLDQLAEEVLDVAQTSLPGIGCLAGAYETGTQIEQYLNNQASIGSTLWSIAGAVSGCADLVPAFAAYKLTKIVVKEAINAVNIGITTYNCLDALKPKKPVTKPTSKVNSFDPNEKVGPLTYQNLSHDFNYGIYFENVDSATAAAQQVLVIDSLDLNSFDLSTFRFGGIGFGNQYSVNTAIDRSHLNLLMDLRPEKDLIVSVTGELNLQTGVAIWQFNSLDPSTMQLTLDPFLGFLDPNDSTGRGQGFVQYNIDPLNTLQTGDSIQNSATIIFDYNNPIVTNTWTNTIDLVAPVSQIVNLPDAIFQPGFDVNWTGFDPQISGVEHYQIYYKENNGEFQLWLDNYHGTTAHFTGLNNSWYSFYTIAVDSAGNVESAPIMADDSTFVSFVYYEPILAIESSVPACSGSLSGSIHVSIEGGNQPFEISLNNSIGSGIYDGLASGNYHLVIKNALQMIDLDTTIALFSALPISYSASTSGARCAGEQNGSVTVLVSGGVGGYVIDWFGQNPDSLFAGSHSFSITDTNGCSVQGMIDIQEPLPLSSTLDIVNVTAESICDGAIVVTSYGGTAGYSILWNDVQNSTTFSLSQLCEGSYSAIVTDANGCKDSTISLIGVTSIESTRIMDNVRVLPNPSSGLVTLEVSLVRFGKADLIIYNASGAIVWSKKNVRCEQGENQWKIDLSEQSAGSYMLEFKNEEFSFKRSIFIAR